MEGTVVHLLITAVTFINNIHQADTNHQQANQELDFHPTNQREDTSCKIFDDDLNKRVKVLGTLT